VKVLVVILIALLALLQYRLWFGPGGYTDINQLEQRLELQQQENASMLNRNDELRAEVEDLRERLDAVEERARSELGLIREGEEFYQVVPGAGAQPDRSQPGGALP
jgi:cell division protein FtsB